MTSRAGPLMLQKMAPIITSGKFVLKPLRGFTFIGLMIIIAISGILLAAVGTVWQNHVQRDRENDLLYYGDAYRRAITQYYDQTPSGIKQFPKKLTDLVTDRRFPKPRHHIRVLYPNPIAEDGSWQLIRVAGRIQGVTTTSDQVPIKVSGFPTRYTAFEQAQTYADWQFVYQKDDTGQTSTNNAFEQKPSTGGQTNPFK